MPQCVDALALKPARKVYVPPQWLLTALCAMDEVEPGLAARALRASDARRQIIAACISSAMGQAHWSEGHAIESDALQALLDRLGGADRLLTRRHAKLLERAYGDCPPGLARAIEKTGAEIADPVHYLRLYSIFTSPARKQEAKFVSGLSEVDPITLELGHALPSELLRAAFLGRMGRREFKRLGTVLPLLRALSPQLSDHDWSEKLKTLAKQGSPASFAKNVVKDAALPPPPLDGDDHVWPLATVRMMLDAARKFRNCMRDMVVEALQGQIFFYEADLLGTPAIIKLDRDMTTSGWELEGVYGKHNEDVPDDVKQAAGAWLEAKGLQTGATSPRNWQALEWFWERGEGRVVPL